MPKPFLVVLEVVAHMELAQPLAKARRRVVVVKGVVDLVVDQVADQEARRDGRTVHGTGDQEDRADDHDRERDEDHRLAHEQSESGGDPFRAGNGEPRGDQQCCGER